METNKIRTRKLFIFNMINFIKKYYRFGCKLYPILFQISLWICPLNFINLFTGRFNNWNMIALICYAFFFGGIFIAFILNGRNKMDKQL